MKVFNLLFALILAVGLFLPFAQPVQALSTTLAITGEGTLHSNTGYSGGTTDYANLNSDDGATSTWFPVNSEEYGYQTYHMQAFASSSTVDSVTLYLKTYHIIPQNYIYPEVYISGTSWYGAALSQESNCVGSTWILHSYTWNVNPTTGIAWTPAEVNAAEFGFRSLEGTGGCAAPIITYMYISVSYTGTAAPVVTTQAVSAITPTTATGNGNVTSDGDSAITERGTVYSLAADPTTGDTKDISAGTTGAFTTSIDTLTKGTFYHVRAYAINAIGTSYGADVEFTTVGDPTISTVAASLVSVTTARVNSQVTFDGAVGGGEACTVTFVYKTGSPYANYAAILAAGGTEVAAAGTYTVGQFPYYDLSSLTLGTLYSFAVKIENSTATPVYGSVMTFTTETGISDTSGLTAIPTSTTISLAWVKGAGSNYTLVRYSSSAYPATVADGVLGYLNTGNSVIITGLIPGTTYYVSAWGKTGASYSATPVNAITTTLAYDSAPSTTPKLVTPTPDSTWLQPPSATKASTIPVFGPLVQTNATAYNQPVEYLWYFIWMLVAVGAAIVVYIRGNYNFVLSFSVMIGIIGIGVWWYNIVAGMIVVVLAVIGIGWALVGFRRPGT
jgi:hypothetical protein